MRLLMNQTLKSLKIFKYQYSVRFDFIPCTLDANIPTPRLYCTRRMQFHQNSLAPRESARSHGYCTITKTFVTVEKY